MIKIIVNIIVIVLVIILLRVLTSCEARNGHMHQVARPTLAKQVESKHYLVLQYYIVHKASHDTIKVKVFNDHEVKYIYSSDKFETK